MTVRPEWRCLSQQRPWVTGISKGLMMGARLEQHGQSVSASAGHLPWEAPIHAVGLPWAAVNGGCNDMTTYK